jgi:putative ABC transport system permease protein
LPEVVSVKPLHVTLATWRIPANAQTTDENKQTAGGLRGIVAIGMEPSQNVFNTENLPEIERQAPMLLDPAALLIDRKTKGDDYGAVNGIEFGEDDLDREVEVWDKKFRIAGCFRLGAGLAANGSVLMGRSAYARFYPADTEHLVNFGLVQLRAGVRPKDFCARVKKELSGSAAGSTAATTLPVDVLTRQEVLGHERWHWLMNTPIGSIFMAGVALALVVGSVVVYMVLSNDVANHLREYATLKAMGYTDGFLRRVVMQQAVVMAVLGYLVSLACAEVLYRIVGYYANLPLRMTWQICGSVLIMSVGMCCASGLATLNKLGKAQPADLF